MQHKVAVTPEGKRTGIADLKKFFGLAPGQDLSGFAEECRKLTDDDYRELGEELSKV